ncbi:MAG TPA: TVP38/TMEM64 family protein [Deltaproteobacteria bacterium]|nr:TVP38/TMEM64 family protein [Deltaproteobacteria bacterium]
MAARTYRMAHKKGLVLMKRARVKFTVLALLVAGGALTIRWLGASGYLTEESLKEWIEGYGLWGPVVYILVYSIAPALMAPGLPLTVVGGILFGPLWGVVYTAIGATTGATVAFLIARYLGREWVAEKIRGTRLEVLDREVERRGWKVVAFTRLIPLFPFNLLNYAFGLTGIGLFTYVVASFVFMLPGIVAYVVFSDSLFALLVRGELRWKFLAALGLVATVSLLPLLYRWYRKGRTL